MTKTVTVYFLFKNELCDQLQLWMTIPLAIQSVYEMNTIPVQVTDIPTGEQLALDGR